MDKNDLFREEKRILLMISAVCAVLALIFPVTYYLDPAITGLIVKSQEASYSDKLSLVLNESSEQIWAIGNHRNIKSVKISGSLENNGSAKVYIETSNKTYLVFDSSLLEEEHILDKITGFAVAEINASTEYNESIEINATTTNESIKGSDEPVLNETLQLNETIDEPILNETVQLNETINDTIINQTEEIVIINETVDEPILNETPQLNETINGTVINQTEGNLIINETVDKQAINRTNLTITINLNYKTGSDYDIDDNGIETTKGVIDLSVENTLFSWDVDMSEIQNISEYTPDYSAFDKSKLCTRWETYSTEKEESTVVCYGNEQCCNLFGLSSSSDNWNDVFYSYYGLYGAGFNNIIYSQIIYADYNLSIDKLYAEIYISEKANLTADYYRGTLKFNDVCIETCNLFDLNETNYKLIFEINETILYLDSIEYSIIKEIPNNPPILVKNISNISINRDQNYTINLSEYFYDGDGDNLSYDYHKINNISIVIEENVTTIVPEKGFTGIRYTFFKANDSESIAISNVFKINVSEKEFKELEQLKAEINKPVKWIKRSKNNTIKIPDYAFNLSIKKNINNQKTAVNKSKIKIRYKDKIKSLDEFENKAKKEKIKKSENETEIIINETADSYEIIYETEAPRAYEEIVDDFNKKIKISSEISYTSVLAYTNISESLLDDIKLYWYKNGSKVDVTNNEEINLSFVDSDNDTLIERLEWNVPHLSNQTFEVSITILNVQSYPTVGGNWVVEFNTTRTANLTITAINGTTWSNKNEDNDLKFLEIRCNDVILNYNWIGESVFIENYSCNSTGYHTVKVLTEGVHTQLFSFGGQNATAHNFAQNIIAVFASRVWLSNMSIDAEKIVIKEGGDLTLTKNSNFKMSNLEINRTGDAVFIHKGSELRID